MLEAQVATIGFLWFSTSAVISTYSNTKFLQEFGSPLAHTVVRFAISALIGFLTSVLQPKGMRSSQILPLMWGLRLPAVLLLAANLLNSVALGLSGITLCYVCKSGIPVFTVVVMLLQGQHFAPMVYLSLLPTVLGVALASASDLDFSLAGLVAALGSALAQTLLNVVSKKRLKELQVTGMQAQFLMASFCILLSWPLYMLHGDGGAVFAQAAQTPRAAAILILAGISYHAEYTLNFMFTPFVSPLAFSITDIARRLSIILAGAALFGKSLTVLNMLGITLALSGVLWYSHLSSTAVSAKVPGSLRLGLLAEQRAEDHAAATVAAGSKDE